MRSSASSSPSRLVAFVVLALAAGCAVSAPPEVDEAAGESGPAGAGATARRTLQQSDGEDEGGEGGNTQSYASQFYGLGSLGDDDGDGGGGSYGGPLPPPAPPPPPSPPPPPDGGYPLFSAGYPTVSYHVGTNTFTFAGALDRPGAVFFVVVRGCASAGRSWTHTLGGSTRHHGACLGRRVGVRHAPRRR
jgi:hypothetical protein